MRALFPSGGRNAGFPALPRSAGRDAGERAVGRTDGVRIPSTQQAAWDALTRDIRRCERCPLHQTRTQAVVYRGVPRPAIVFVGEAPGAEEDRQGLPFVGRAGRRLDEAIGNAGIPVSEVGILNVLKCRPPQNRFDRGAAATCRPYLDRQIDLLAPRLLVTLGRWALSTLVPEAPPMLTAAGVPRVWSGRPLLPLLHPAATFRSRAFLERWNRDLKTLQQVYLALRHETL